MKHSSIKFLLMLLAIVTFAACGGEEGQESGNNGGSGSEPTTDGSTEGTPSAGPKVDLKLNLAEGKTYKLMTTTDQDIQQKPMGQTQNMEQTIGLGLTHTVEGLTEDGNAVVKVTYEKVRYVNDGNPVLGRTEYDSDNPPAEVPLMAQGFAGLVGQSFNMTITPEGKVTDISGVEDMISKMADGMDVSEAEKAQMKEQLKMQFGDQALKESMENTMAIYPENPVGVGDTWEKEVSITSGFPMTVKNRYTVKSVSDSRVILDVESDVTTNDAAMDVGGMNIDYDLGGSQSGVIEIDRNTGWVVKSTMTQDINGDVAAQGMNWPISIKSEISVKEY